MLNLRLLDVVEVPNRLLGEERPGSALGTIVELLGDGPGHLLVEVCDEQGVASDLIAVAPSQVTKVWSAPERAEDHTPPVDAQTRYERGIALLQNGLASEAKGELRAAFKGDHRLVGALMNSANDLANRRLYDPAIFLYDLILELQQDYRLAKDNLASTFINRGVQRGRSGALDQAIQDFTSALLFATLEDARTKAQHNLVAALTRLGILFSDRGLYGEALSTFLIAFQIKPEEITRRNVALATLSTQVSKTEFGRRAPTPERFSQFRQMGLTDSECFNAFGATMARLGDISAARQAFSNALQADPSNTLAQQNLATIEKLQEGAGLPPMPIGVTSMDLQPLA